MSNKDDYELGLDILGISLSLPSRPIMATASYAISPPKTPAAAAAAAAAPPVSTPRAAASLTADPPKTPAAAAAAASTTPAKTMAAMTAAVAPKTVAAMKPQAKPVDTSKITAAASRANAMSVKLAKLAPKAATKLASHAQKINARVAKAKAASPTTVKGDVLGVAKVIAQRALQSVLGAGPTYTISQPAAPAPAPTTSSSTGASRLDSSMSSAGSALAATGAFAAASMQIHQDAGELNIAWATNVAPLDAATQAGQIIATVTPLITQLTAPPAPSTTNITLDPNTGMPMPPPPLDPTIAAQNQALAAQGQTIVTNAQAIIDAFNPDADTPDQSLVDQANQLQTTSATWVTQAQAAIAGISTAMSSAAQAAQQAAMMAQAGMGGGYGGGGGGGGGGDDGGGGGGGGDAGDDGAFADDDGGGGGGGSADGGDSMDPDARADARDDARAALDDTDENGNDSSSDVMGYFGGTTVGHFDLHETDDLNLDQHEIQITDVPADPNRKSASLHHGAAYLQLRTYPRGGASEGQEGGDMIPTERIEIFGDSYERGLDILGAVVAKPAAPTPRVQFFHKTTPGGNKAISMVPTKPKKGDHATSIKNATDAGNRAVKIGQKLLKAVDKGAVKAPAHVLGAAAKAVHKHLTAEKVKQIAAAAVKAGNDVIKNAQSHGQHVTATKNATDTGTKALAKSLVQPTGTKLHGEEILGATIIAAEHAAYASVLGDAAADAALLQAGGIDPTTGQPIASTTAAVDPTTGQPVDPAAAATAASTLGPPPTGIPPLVANVDFVPGPPIETDDAQYSSLPLGGIYYDGSRGAAKWYFRSFHSYKDPETCVFWRGDWWGIAYRPDDDWEGPVNQFGPAIKRGLSNASTGPDMNNLSLQMNWGPLIGAIEKERPTHGLRYIPQEDKYFWFYDQAPDWAKAPGDQLRLQQAMLDYKAAQTAQAADAAAAAAQDQLDADTAKAQAKQDAIDAAQLAKDTAAQAAQDAITQRQQEQQDAATSRQADTDIKQAQAQAEIDQRAADAQAAKDVQFAQIQADADAKAAELAARFAPQPQAQQGGGGGDDGGGSDDGGGDSFADEKASMDEQMMGESLYTNLTGSAKLKAKRNRHK